MKGITVSGLCRAAGISRQSYYQGWRERQRSRGEEERILHAVRLQRRSLPRVGGRKLQHLLRAAGVKVGRDALLRILGKHQLLVERKRKAVRTTYYDQSLPVYRNLLYQLEPTQPHQVWVSDITFVSIAGGFIYLSLITDLVSRRIVGWNAGDTNTAAESLKALGNAMEQLPAGRWPIHHSDRGSQYCCHEYVAALNARGLPISMTEQNHCYENCYAERVNGILKDEFHLDRSFRTRDQAQRAIAEAIEAYNTLRPHTSLQLRTPDQRHQLAA